MHKANDVRQKLIDHMMELDLDKMSLSDINLYTLILSQLALSEAQAAPSWAQLGVGLAAATPTTAFAEGEVA